MFEVNCLCGVPQVVSNFGDVLKVCPSSARIVLSEFLLWSFVQISGWMRYTAVPAGYLAITVDIFLPGDHLL